MRDQNSTSRSGACDDCSYAKEHDKNEYAESGVTGIEKTVRRFRRGQCYLPSTLPVLFARTNSWRPSSVFPHWESASGLSYFLASVLHQLGFSFGTEFVKTARESVSISRATPRLTHRVQLLGNSKHALSSSRVQHSQIRFGMSFGGDKGLKLLIGFNYDMCSSRPQIIRVFYSLNIYAHHCRRRTSSRPVLRLIGTFQSKAMTFCNDVPVSGETNEPDTVYHYR